MRLNLKNILFTSQVEEYIWRIVMRLYTPLVTKVLTEVLNRVGIMFLKKEERDASAIFK